MNKEDVTAWLQANHEYLDISALARGAGIDASMLVKIAKRKPDSRGYAVKLPAKYVPALTGIIEQMQAIPDASR